MSRKILITICFIWVVVMEAFSQTPELKFTKSKFKIIQFTDLHLIRGGKYDQISDSTFRLVRYLISDEKPDFVVFTGDVVVSGQAVSLWKELTGILNDLKVPFAVTFGNHDTETDISLQKALEVISESPFNVTTNAASVSGVGNCAVRISDRSGKDAKWVLYFLDSHAYSGNPAAKGYDWIKDDQIAWYRHQSEAFARGKNGPVPALAFFHIPLQEYSIVMGGKSAVGNKKEDVCSPALNSGLFSAFVERNDVAGVFAGHDHNNDFIGEYCNIALAYGRKTGYASAYKELLERGARIINLSGDAPGFETHIRTMSGNSFDYTFQKKKL